MTSNALKTVISTGTVVASGSTISSLVVPTATSLVAQATSSDVGLGGSVAFTLTATQPLTVTGMPELTLNNAGVAIFAGTTASGALLFRYTPKSGQTTADVKVTGLTLNGGTITNSAGAALSMPASLPASLAGGDTHIAIDTTPPVLIGVNILAHGSDLAAGDVAVIAIEASEAIKLVSGKPVLTLNTGATATYLSTTNGVLLFSYQVPKGVTSSGLGVTSLTLPPGTVITDAAGNPLAGGSLSGLPGATSKLQIATTGPTITPPTISALTASAPRSDLGIGDVVTFTLTPSKALVVTGQPALTLNDGGTANYTGTNASGQLMFAYTVLAGQTSSALAVTGLSLPSGASLHDAAGNALSTSGLASLPGATTSFRVDTVVPAVTAIEALTGETGTLTPGTTVTFALSTTEPVIVTGTPILTLNDGATAVYSGMGPNGQLDFTYVVGASTTAKTLAAKSLVLAHSAAITNAASTSATALAVTGLTLPSGAAITDGAGNPLILSGIATVSGATTDLIVGSSKTTSGGGTTTVGGGGTSTSTPWANAGLVAVGAPTVPAGATVLTVGAGEEYSSLKAALAAAHDGDVIEVQAGTYVNDFATVNAKVSIEGVGGMATFVATAPPTNLKGILTVDDDVYVANLAFTGAAIDAGDGGNGAGIRYEGGQMSLYNDSFTDNQDGILANAVIPQLTVNTISINHSFFDQNGSGSGFTHNVYIGAVSELTFTNSITESAVVGHDLKSRAQVNIISDNIISDGTAGSASYDIDLPNGGADTVSDNLIVKGSNAQNNAMLHYGGEGIPYGGSTLTVTGNDFVNNLGPQAVGVLNQTAISANIVGNTFTALSSGQVASGPATETKNVDGTGAALPDSTLVGVLPGDTLVITDDAAHSVTLSSTLQAVEGGAGLLTAYALGGHVIAIGGAGGMIFSESPTSGGNQITTAAKSTNTITLVGQDVLDSEGTDQITTGAGNVTSVVNGVATISDGDASNQWTVNGRATITGHGGSPVVQVGASATVAINGDVSYLAVSSNGGNVGIDVTEGGAEEAMSVSGGGASVIVNSSAINVTTASGVGGSTIRFGAGAVDMMSGGADTIYAGTGSDSFQVSGPAMIYAGTGSLSVFGRSDTAGATIVGAGGTYTLGGDTGNLTYEGGAAASTVELDLSRNHLVGGSGHLTINGGSRETIAGGSGGLTFNEDGGGGNTITTQAGSSNTLSLSGTDNVQSWGDDTISAGTGNQSIEVHGAALINGSSGNSQLILHGKDTLFGVGQDWVTVTSGASVAATAGLGEYISETAATVSLQVGTSTATVSGAGSASLTNVGTSAVSVTTNATAPVLVTLGAGQASVQSQGADTIQAGVGAASVSVAGSGALIEGGAGALTVTDTDWTAGSVVTIDGGTGALTYSQAAGLLVFNGGSGSAVLNGDYGSLDVNAGSGNITINGGGTVNFVAGSGNAQVTVTPSGGTITFGSGNTNVSLPSYGPAVLDFVAGKGGGHDVISGFQSGADTLHFEGVSVKSVAHAAGGSVLSLSDSTSITLVGVNYS